MTEREALIADLDQECGATRRLLERLPETSLAWQPHERSFSLAGLATHLGQLPHWGTQILTQSHYDLATATGQTTLRLTVADILAGFDGHVAELRQALSALTETDLMATWSLTRGPEVLLSMPKLAAVRRFMIHHLVHHRGQLTVYLRLLDVPLVPLYGPTADDRP